MLLGPVDQTLTVVRNEWLLRYGNVESFLNCPPPSPTHPHTLRDLDAFKMKPASATNRKQTFWWPLRVKTTGGKSIKFLSLGFFASGYIETFHVPSELWICDFTVLWFALPHQIPIVRWMVLAALEKFPQFREQMTGRHADTRIANPSRRNVANRFTKFG